MKSLQGARRETVQPQMSTVDKKSTIGWQTLGCKWKYDDMMTIHCLGNRIPKAAKLKDPYHSHVVTWRNV